MNEQDRAIERLKTAVDALEHNAVRMRAALAQEQAFRDSVVTERINRLLGECQAYIDIDQQGRPCVRARSLVTDLRDVPALESDDCEVEGRD